MSLAAAEKRILAMLVRLSDDQLSVQQDGACLHRAGNGEAARLLISDRRAFAAFAGGSLAAAQAYINGWWSSPDLPALMRLAAGNIHAINSSMDGGWRRRLRVLAEALAAGRRRMLGRKGAAADIAAHYDLGNEFFSLWLDDTLAYSCAVFPDIAAAGADALPQASRRKLDKICDKLELAPSDHLLDLGCGWGSMTFRAAAQRQCRVCALTLSPAQHRFVADKAAASGGQVQAVLSDYRDFAPRGRFSKISSVEMIEAVGEQHFAVYFQRIRALLADDGLAQVQAITIPDARYRTARRDGDFIRRYIFPGGALPSPAIIRAAAASAGLHLLHTEEIGAHYAPTLLGWRQRFLAQRRRIQEMEFDDAFCRTWEYYFCYCAGAFAAGALGAAQYLFAPVRRA